MQRTAIARGYDPRVLVYLSCTRCPVGVTVNCQRSSSGLPASPVGCPEGFDFVLGLLGLVVADEVGVVRSRFVVEVDGGEGVFRRHGR
ncbi:MAG: hypothetical protein ACRDQU_08765 [Pseudonocardiaceae bacterium]